MDDRKQYTDSHAPRTRAHRRRARRYPLAPYPNVYAMRSRAPSGVVMSLMFALAGALGFVVGVILISASVTTAFGAEKAPSCGPEFRETLYLARFELNGPKSIRVGRSRALDGRPATLAVIKNSRTGSCDAVCEIQSLEILDSTTPMTMQLTCRDTSLGAIRTPAALLWAKSSPLTFPAIRFGSWLAGYRHAKLSVDIDAYSQTRPVSIRILRKYARNDANN